MTLAAALALVLAALFLGLFIGARCAMRDDLPSLLLFSTLAGCLMIFAAAWIVDSLDIAWQRHLLAPPLLFGLIASWHLAPRPLAPNWDAIRQRISSPLLYWGDWIGFGSFIVFTASSLLLMNLHSDFIYHWGIKGQRFFLAQGIDHVFLSDAQAFHLQPDYPLLLPILYALTAIFGLEFNEQAMALWTALFLALMLVALRRSVDFLPHHSQQWTLATVSLVCVMFGVKYQMAGGADVLIALAIAASLLPLSRPPGWIQDRQIALIAAFAAAAKMEGMVFAALLLLVYGGRLARTDMPWTERIRAMARTVVLPLAVVGAWIVWCVKQGWWGNRGASLPLSEQIDRLPQVMEGLGKSFLTVDWHGFPLVLLLLPLFLFVQRWRSVALLLVLQLGFYVYVYVSTPLDAIALIETSAARLYFHLVPATLTLFLAVLLEPTSGTKLFKKTLG